jgi:hypothetical protein
MTVGRGNDGRLVDVSVLRRPREPHLRDEGGPLFARVGLKEGPYVEMLVVMVALLVAAFVVMPGWPYSVRWGYFPASTCGFLALVMAALVLVGRL